MYGVSEKKLEREKKLKEEELLNWQKIKTFCKIQFCQKNFFTKLNAYVNTKHDPVPTSLLVSKNKHLSYPFPPMVIT